VRVDVSPLAIAGVTMLLSWLMVSTVKYRSAKKMKFPSADLALLGAVLISATVVSLRMGLNFFLIWVFSAYILIGLIEEVLFHKQRKAALVATSNARVLIEEDEDPSDDVDA
jgi:CDP-diacylglycerol--serine O-phosphatidyltransferase